jgi:hypothetical protein
LEAHPKGYLLGSDQTTYRARLQPVLNTGHSMLPTESEIQPFQGQKIYTQGQRVMLIA